MSDVGADVADPPLQAEEAAPLPAATGPAESAPVETVSSESAPADTTSAETAPVAAASVETATSGSGTTASSSAVAESSGAVETAATGGAGPTDDQHTWLSALIGIDTRAGSVGGSASASSDAPVSTDDHEKDGGSPSGVLDSLGSMTSGAGSAVLSVASTALDAGNTAVLKAGAADAFGAIVNGTVDTVNDTIHSLGGTDDVDTTLGKAAQFADKTLTPILDPAKFAPRALNGDERNYAHAIFFDTLNYDPITITGGGVATIGEDLTETECRTIGNSIGLSPDMFNANGTLTGEGMQTLVHEMTHVWQYQHNGWSYMRKALVAQGAAQLMQGDRNEAYDWERLAKAGTPWEQWNPEAQAKAVEEYNIALRAANGGSTDPSIYQKLGALQPYLDKMTAGTERGDHPNPDPDQKTG